MPQLIGILQIDQPICANVFGVSPCTATGEKCYNTYKTCKDKPNYVESETPLTLSFHSECENPLLSPGLFPTMKSWDRKAGVINIASADPDKNPLGVRDVMTFNLTDHPYHDRYVDPYFRTRSYNAIAQGTFWSKWIARNDNYDGIECRFYQGFAGQALELMTVLHYQLEKITGPNSSGGVQIEIIDVLKSADNDRAKIPAISKGFLSEALTDSATTFTMTPSGIGSTYPSTGDISIGDEPMVITSKTGDQLTVTRGAEPSAHDEGSVVQVAETIPGQRVDVVAMRWLKDIIGIPATWITDADWEEEAETYLPTYEITRKIYKPEGANGLLGQLLRDCSAFLVPDLEAKKIQLRAIREQAPVKTITEDNEILLGSFQQNRKPEMRLTQLWMWYGMRDELGSTSDRSNFSHNLATAGADFERASQQKIKEIFSRFLRPLNVGEVLQTSNRIMERFGSEPVEYSFTTDRADAEDIKLGDVILLGHREIVDETGAGSVTPVQIISVHPQAQGTKVSFMAQSYGFDFSATLWALDDTAPWATATDEEKTLYLYWSNDEGVIDGDIAPTWGA